MAPYAKTYAAPQMSTPVAPEMVYAGQQVYASQQYVPAQYAFPAFPEEEVSDTSGWSQVAMFAVAGAVIGGVIGSKKKQPVKRSARIPVPVMMSPETHGNVHGDGGAYVGGYWSPIEECKETFNMEGGSNEKVPATPCPRSRTRHSAANPDGSYDVVIIGSGCIGAAVARELSKTTASVLMVEAGDDVCQGATKGNSGIVHAGFDDTPGTTRARLCWKGNQMFADLDRDLHFGYQLTGSLVVARGDKEEKHLAELLKRGETNGVKNLRIVRGDELRAMEPHLDPAATAALYSPDAGTLIPYEYTIALAENAADNGVEVRIRRAVESIQRADDGLFDIQVNHWEPADYAEDAKARQNPLQRIASAFADTGKAP